MTEIESTTGLLISVGGTAAPLAYSINQHCPSKIIFFASTESQSEIETKVRQLATHSWQAQEIITTDDPQDLTKCVIALQELAQKMDILQISAENLIVDYTGGTKTMSAALVLSTISLPVRYSYIGGRVRAKKGLGAVLDGTEALVTKHNVWDVLAVELERRLVNQFNHAHFSEAYATAEEAEQKVGEREKSLYRFYKEVCQAYKCWDNFDYPTALRHLETGEQELKVYANGGSKSAVIALARQVENDRGRLVNLSQIWQQLQEGQSENLDTRSLIIDLVANAVRTTRMAERADDGIARLSSALEKLAQLCLLEQGIDNRKTQAEQIPEALREEYIARHRTGDNNLLQYGLIASYRLLDALEHPVGKRYRARETDLKNVLEIHNRSFMVHGWQAIKTETFDNMLEITLDFLEMAETDLPKFPQWSQNFGLGLSKL
jgi:CRISPR-associated protein (TIGR02710 family)